MIVPFHQSKNKVILPQRSLPLSKSIKNLKLKLQSNNLRTKLVPRVMSQLIVAPKHQLKPFLKPSLAMLQALRQVNKLMLLKRASWPIK